MNESCGGIGQGCPIYEECLIYVGNRTGMSDLRGRILL